MSHILERTTFKTSRLLEFFTEKELAMQIGHAKDWWPIALVKELLDNALDACEEAGIPPRIEVTVDKDSVSVKDNGPGLPAEILQHSLDYLIRVSDKNHYVSPTRGQLGNALKCVWAAPFVVDGEHGRVEVTTGGQTHQVDVSLDRIAQQPKLDHTLHPDGLVKNGALVKMHWPQVASSLCLYDVPYFYNPPIRAADLVSRYAAFNPHAAFHYADLDSAEDFPATNPAWRKWQPHTPTSPHWYTIEKLRALIAAHVSAEREGGKVKTVREFVSEFNGLKGTARQKQVTEAIGLSGAYLHDLVVGDDVAREPVARLLAAMQAASRPVKPKALGEIGQAHLTRWLQARFCELESVKYKKVAGEADGLPFVLEVAFGVHTVEYEDSRGDRVIGLNWTPMLTIPLGELSAYLGDNRVDSFDPVEVIVHLACPRLEFTDRGKSRLDLPGEIKQALETAVKSVTKGWKQAKRQADQDERVRQKELDDLRKAKKRTHLSVKEAAFEAMAQAYMHASANNTLPANARQIMYAARPSVLELAGGKCWKNSSYFTQRLLPEFIDLNPELTADWDVVYDARGKLIEPHRDERTDTRIDLGTLAVRRYVANWTDENYGLSDKGQIVLKHRIDTTGPTNRYQYAMFIEKEGFNELFDSVRLADRYDLTIMSTKGMSVTAARQLVAALSKQGVTILVLRDFDKAGFSIVGTLKGNTRRWQYETPPNIIDLGLRLEDVELMGLQSEAVYYRSKVNPNLNLLENGATETECNFLVRGGYPKRWHGERVELNAMTSEQMIGWLENKLDAMGVTKIIPPDDVLTEAYKRALHRVAVQRAVNKAIADYDGAEVSIPPDLRQAIYEKLQAQDTRSWDDVIYDLAAQQKDLGG